MVRYSLHAIGNDRPGIVAAVTGVLADVGCNLEDSRMSILHGQFAVMLVVETAFGRVKRDLDLLVVLRQLPEQTLHVELGETVAVAVHGADRPGIVSSVAQRIADLGGNIVDLSTHKIEEGEQASYVLLVSVTTGESCSEENLRVQLNEVAKDLGVTCVVHAGSNELL
jgi:glycine cleavage system transcriptional repressor